MEQNNHLVKLLGKLQVLMMAVAALLACSLVLMVGIEFNVISFGGETEKGKPSEVKKSITQPVQKVGAPDIQGWQAPDTTDIPRTPEGDLVRYGRELIAHTSVYLGPKGKIKKISNGLNCQNCHLQGGSIPFGNNFSVTAYSYPKFRSRSGKSEDIVYRVNGCFERSMNGQHLDPDSREMKAFIAYFKWMGQGVIKGDKPYGAGLSKVLLLDRAASPEKGKELYTKHCALCHGSDGQGVMAPSGLEYIYPPLYGDHSFNTGAGMYRLMKFARFIKTNMPLGVTYENPLLTDEECWDIAAYINSQPRPVKDLSADWPNIEDKPFDHPFGPFADKFSEKEHKYGPYQPMLKE